MLVLLIGCLGSSSGLLHSQSLASVLHPEGGFHRETLKAAEKKLRFLMKSTDFKTLKARRFSSSKPAETRFSLPFDPRKNGQTLGVYYFIPTEGLLDRPTVEILDGRGNPTSLKKRFFLQDGLIVYDVFPLELPRNFTEDQVRFKASTPGKFLAFLN
ncbi:hypothetical protein [Larkinella ripae]